MPVKTLSALALVPEQASPPASPVDGQLWIYAGSGFHWMFVRDESEATYKWKFIGGGDLTVAVATDQTVVEGSSYVDAATVVQATVPRAGDYEVLSACNMYVASQTAGAQSAMGMTASSGSWDSIAGAGTSPTTTFVAAGGVAVNQTLTDIIRGIAASGTLKQQYQMAAVLGGTAHVRWRTIRVRPIRVS